MYSDVLIAFKYFRPVPNSSGFSFSFLSRLSSHSSLSAHSTHISHNATNPQCFYSQKHSKPIKPSQNLILHRISWMQKLQGFSLRSYSTIRHWQSWTCQTTKLDKTTNINVLSARKLVVVIFRENICFWRFLKVSTKRYCGLVSLVTLSCHSPPPSRKQCFAAFWFLLLSIIRSL